MFRIFMQLTFGGMLYFLLVAVQKEMNFSFSKVEVEGKYGSRREDGSWSGQIGALHRREIDISIHELTIAYDRAQVNFTVIDPLH